MKMRNRPGGKRHETPSFLEPTGGPPGGRRVMLRRPFLAQHFNLKEPRTEGGETGKKGVGEKAKVPPAFGEKGSEQKTVQTSEGVVPHHQKRAFGRNPVQLFIGYSEVHFEDLQKMVEHGPS